FKPIIDASAITTVFTTGHKATELYTSLCAAEAGLPTIYLPSTSPANRSQQAKPIFKELWAEVGKCLNND
ncbi:MAG: hypothetical protein LBU61_00505, partial [Coriobacteriales bacterium]|nr:hypothetical protein [Coriobacteriales bacterium]